MKKIFTILLLISVFINLNAEEKYTFKSSFAFLSGGTLLSSFKDARVALKTFLEDMAAKHGGEIETAFYHDENELYKDFRKNKFDMVVLSLPFYFKNKKDIESNSRDLWSLSMTSRTYSQYYLLTNAKSKISGFKDIKNKTISFKKDDNVSKIWLDKSSLEVNKKSAKNLLKEIIYTSKETTALLNVFFKKRDLAIVSRKTWDTMIELNPAIKKKIKILKKSEPIHLPFIGFFSKNSHIEARKAFFKLSSNLRQLEGSEQVFTILKFNSVFKVDEKSLNKLQKYYTDYFKLKKRYK